MNNLQYKLKAFTILEITISMLIASISIVISYTAYTIMNKSYKDFDQKNKKLIELAIADKQLRRDFMVAKVIRRSENGILLTDDKGRINYEFGSNYILRNQYGIRIDTLQISVSDFSSGFENKISDIGDLIDKLNINIISNDGKTELSYLKLYSARDLVENVMNH